MDLLQFITGTFSRRFFLNALLPTFVFTGVLSAGYVVLDRGLAPTLMALQAQPVFVQIVMAFLYLAVVYLLSAAVASQWRGIVRVFEGYPVDAIFGRMRLATPGRRWHAYRRLDLIEDPRRQVEAYYSYSGRRNGANASPTSDRVMPTRLGNILLAGEDYSRIRYGIDSIIFWPRLFPLLPEDFRKEYDEFIINHEFPLVVAFESALSTLALGAMMLWFHAAPLTFAVAFGLGTAIAYGSYVLALPAATELAEQQRTAFDLYRDRLLLAWPAVEEIRDVGKAFLLIEDFVVQGTIDDDGWDGSRSSFLERQKGVDQGST